MGTKHFGVLGLFIAMIFGARGANRLSEGHSGTRTRHAETAQSAKEPKSQARTKTASARESNDCGEKNARKHQWWLSSSGGKDCSLSLSPAWKQICKINPTHRDDAYFLDPGRTESDFLAACLGERGKTKSMMAAVPNPQRTHLGLMTDRAIEAIQVAAAEAHFLPLAHYLPWPAPGADGASADSTSEVASISTDPGVLVFLDVDTANLEDTSKESPKGQASNRRAKTPNSERPQYLLVFLIPEVPTEGLDRQAFANAEAMIEKVSPNMPANPFAGPNFSGSVASLSDLSRKDGGEPIADETRRDSRKATEPQKCIHALSGSVTNADPYVKGCSTFEVMQTRDSEAICRFVVGAKSFGYDGKEIAILSEEGTLYGRQGDTEEETDSTRQRIDCTSAGQDGATEQLWFLHFPREISKLRNAYGAEAGKSTSSDSTAQPGLGLQWQDVGAAQHDDLQTYGGRQTPLSQETVLSTLSITLKAQGIKALGILATDPMDEAFLIHSIRESSPNVRLFLRDPDLLFLRTPDVGSLNGTLLVSNYPLIPQNQFWSVPKDADEKDSNKRDDKDKPGSNSAEGTRARKNQPQHLLITFPSSFQEGEYNSFVQLMQDSKWAPRDDMKLLEWNWPTGEKARKYPSEYLRPSPCPKSHPSSRDYTRFGCRPLWLAAIGTAGHYPIKMLNYNEVDKQELGLHSLNLGPPQFAPIAIWGIVAMLGVLHFLMLRFPRAAPSYFSHDFDVEDPDKIVTLVKLFCHTMAILTITVTQFILGSSYIFFWNSDPKYFTSSAVPWYDKTVTWISNSKYLTLAATVSAITLFLLWVVGRQLRCSYLLYRHQRQIAVPDDNAEIIAPARIFRSSIAGVAIFVSAALYWSVNVFGPRFDSAFLHFRNLNLSSGVTPNLPLASVLLVLYFGIWTYLRRLSYWQHRYIDMFTLKLDPVIHRDLSTNVRAIESCLLGPLENSKWMLGFAATLFACILTFRPWVTLDMIEPVKVARLIGFFFVLTLLTMWLNWFRFINIWYHLRAILDYLENMPIRAAFKRLPHEKSLPILQGSSSPSNFLLRQVLDRVRALARVDLSAQQFLNQFEQCIDALNPGAMTTQIVGYRKVSGGTSVPVLVQIPQNAKVALRDAQNEMTLLTEALSSQLVQAYWTRGSAGIDAATPDPADQKFILAEDIVALPFYAYIRKVISELRNILFFLGLAISLLFIALHTYAFRADQAIDWWFFGLFGVMGTGIIVVVAQMERNALLSRFSDRTAGELGTDFYLQLLKYGTVPFLTIFGTQVPWVSNVVLKWVQPALETLH